MGGWERVKQSKMSEGWEGGLKKEKSEKGTKGGAFESALIKARVMDRTCGRACLAFCGVCVHACMGECEGRRRRGGRGKNPK